MLKSQRRKNRKLWHLAGKPGTHRSRNQLPRPLQQVIGILVSNHRSTSIALLTQKKPGSKPVSKTNQPNPKPTKPQLVVILNCWWIKMKEGRWKLNSSLNKAFVRISWSCIRILIRCMRRSSQRIRKPLATKWFKATHLYERSILLTTNLRKNILVMFRFKLPNLLKKNIPPL